MCIATGTAGGYDLYGGKVDAYAYIPCKKPGKNEKWLNNFSHTHKCIQCVENRRIKSCIFMDFWH
jgi:hypothetical protein